MGKLALWILVAVIVMLLVRLLGPAKQRAREAARAREGQEGQTGRSADRSAGDDAQHRRVGELMMSCAVCGVHLPSSDALFARGKVYCSAAHRDQGEMPADEFSPRGEAARPAGKGMDGGE